VECALGSNAATGRHLARNIKVISDTMKKHWLLTLTIFAMAGICRTQEPLIFPPGFLKGVAYSTYQNSGHHTWPSIKGRPESNWSMFENRHTQWFRIDRRKHWHSFMQSASPVDYGHKVGLSAHTWVHMFDDIKLMRELGVNSVRFELPWTDLEPQRGVWNEEAFALFDRYLDALHAAGIKPMVTLYHWVHPAWFSELGGWEKSANIVHFVTYCKEVFKRFGHKISYWCTINEPTVISCCGYILGSHAPGVMNDANSAGLVLGHLLKAHIRIYYALKRMPNGDKVQIGLVHQYTKFEVLKSVMGTPLYAVSKFMADRFNKIFAHDVVMHFLKTGHFRYQINENSSIGFYDSRACQANDFIGLNCYATVTLGPWPTCEAQETMTDMVWAIRPDSLNAAITEIAQLGKPIIITENGIPDGQDTRRHTWITGYLQALKKAVDDGYDVRGYYYWSLLDNYEWNMGHDKKFGLYAVDTLSSKPADKKRILRRGATPFRDYFVVAGS
jgi:beta-glucosidase